MTNDFHPQALKGKVHVSTMLSRLGKVQGSLVGYKALWLGTRLFGWVQGSLVGYKALWLGTKPLLGLIAIPILCALLVVCVYGVCCMEVYGSISCTCSCILAHHCVVLNMVRGHMCKDCGRVFPL